MVAERGEQSSYLPGPGDWGVDGPPCMPDEAAASDYFNLYWVQNRKLWAQVCADLGLDSICQAAEPALI